ncbi:outer membrane protein assembly factor BamE [Pseudomonas luteola]|uniref:outer membrane protein assembly factor BamE n=1 Tax=Pseudomonas luteola TaxID=47886 RepID=UPI0003010A16|nr:outer membrane protein assembly factor BamE [Pseudomonas luteola]RRW39521.1 outer membrane protein assembly factor BamE [Pseudomonas luteola]
MSMQRPGLLGAAVVVCSAVIAYTLVERPNPFDNATFDAQRWLATTNNIQDGNCYRGEMAEDIRHTVLSRGMTQAAVAQVLGEPDSYSTEREYQYVLGLCSGIGMDYDNLHVYFDTSGRLVDSKILQH